MPLNLPTAQILSFPASSSSACADPDRSVADIPPILTPKLLHEVFSNLEAKVLYEHLHNDNASKDCAFGFISPTTAEKVYVRTKKKTVSQLISWSLASSGGKRDGKSKAAYVPYANNPNKQSRWGALDFDAHDGDTARAHAFAVSALRVVLDRGEPGVQVILESSGSGGYHLWLIAKDFRPVNWWVRFLKSVASEVKAPIQPGICEIFPPDSFGGRFGKGMRAPGAWNPGTGSCSQILFQNCLTLLETLIREGAEAAQGREKVGEGEEETPFFLSGK